MFCCPREHPPSLEEIWVRQYYNLQQKYNMCFYSGQCGVRTEKLPDEWFTYDSATSTVSEFYSENSLIRTATACTDIIDSASFSCSDTNDGENDSTVCIYDVQTSYTALQRIAKLPECSISCLSALIHQLRVFKLQRVLKLTSYVMQTVHTLSVILLYYRNMELFSISNHCMRLNNKALENLEIFQNSVCPYLFILLFVKSLYIFSGG